MTDGARTPTSDPTASFTRAHDHQPDPAPKPAAESSRIVTKATTEHLGRVAGSLQCQPPGMVSEDDSRFRRFHRTLMAVGRKVRDHFKRAELKAGNKGKAKTASLTAARPPVTQPEPGRPKDQSPENRRSQEIRESYARRQLAEASKTIKKEHGRSR